MVLKRDSFGNVFVSIGNASSAGNLVSFGRQEAYTSARKVATKKENVLAGMKRQPANDPFKGTETSTPPVISDPVRWKSPVIGITADRQDR